MSLKDIIKNWNSFWFADESPVPVAIMRILFGLLYIQFAVFLAPELHMLFGANSIITADMAHRNSFCPRFSLLDYLPQDDFWPAALLILLALSATCLTLGLFSRISAALVYISLISFEARNFYVFGAPDMVMTTVAFLLIFSQAGQALSLDRLLRIWLTKTPETGPARPSSPWGLRLIQVFFAFVYWAAFSRKILGIHWLDGTAVYYVVHSACAQRFTPSWIFDNLQVCQLLTWGTLVIEFALFALIWIKEFRIPIVIFGIIFHLMMDISLILPQFQFAMIAGLLGFLPPATFTQAMNALKSVVHKIFPNPINVKYDSNVDKSYRWAETLRRLDIFGLVNFIG